MFRSVGSRISGVALVAVAGLIGAVLLVRAATSDESRPSAPDVVYGVTSESSGLSVTLDGAGFSGLGTAVAIHLDTASAKSTKAIAARVPEDSFAPGSLVPITSLGALPLAIGATSSSSAWRLSPPEPTGSISVHFRAIDLTLEDRSTVRVAGDWSFSLNPPPDLARRLRVETLSGAAPATDEGITVQVQGVQRSTTETLITVRVDSQMAVAQLGQPMLVGPGTSVTGAVKPLAQDPTVLLLSFPPTSFGSTLELRMGPFVSIEGSQRGQTTISLRSAMERQGMAGRSGDAGVIDPLTDVASRSGDAPADPISFEFSTSVQHGSGTPTIGITLLGNYDQLGAVRGFSADVELRADWQDSSYRKDPNGVVTEGTTRVFFQIPAGVPESLIITVGDKANIIRGDWRIEISVP